MAELAFAIVEKYDADTAIVTFNRVTLVQESGLDECRQVLLDAMNERPILIADLSQTRIIDGKLTNMFFAFDRRLGHRDGRLIIVAPDHPIGELLKMSRLKLSVAIEPDMETAKRNAERGLGRFAKPSVFNALEEIAPFKDDQAA